MAIIQTTSLCRNDCYTSVEKISFNLFKNETESLTNSVYQFK